MDIKFSCRESMVPGKTITERFENAAKIGLSGIEVVGSSSFEHLEAIKAAIEATGVRASLMSARNLFCLDARPDKRAESVQAMTDALTLCQETGALGFILPPLIAIKMQGGQRIPDLSPLMNTAELERKLLAAILSDLADVALQKGADIIIEPLNRYEQWWPCSIQHGIDICNDVGKPGVSVMADFFHMNIEDADFGESIRKAGALVKNVHLADSQRLMPGYGHTDFKPGFAALKQIGYDDYMAFECGVPGDPFEEFPKAMDYIAAQWRQA